MARNSTKAPTFQADFQAVTKPGPRRADGRERGVVDYPAASYSGTEGVAGYLAEAKARGYTGKRDLTPCPNLPNFKAGPFSPDERKYLGAVVRFRPHSSWNTWWDATGEPAEPVQVDAHGKTEGWVVSLAPAPRHVWVRAGRAFYSVHLDSLVPNEVTPFRSEVLV